MRRRIAVPVAPTAGAIVTVVLLWRTNPTAGARFATLLVVAGVLWAASWVDSHTGSCLMLTILVLIVTGILAMVTAGLTLPP